MSAYIELDHGTGGLLSRELVEGVIVPALRDRYLGLLDDSAVLDVPTGRLAMTTDSFVVDPLFFGGGDIGKIAVCGTVNDLAMSGARPLYLTLGLILEVGLPIEDLQRALHSIADAAEEADVYIVAGDTKIVDRGAADKMFINTAGIGVFADDALPLSNRRISVGDAVVISSEIGAHSVHLLSMREGLGYESRVVSDCAPLNHMMQSVLDRFGTEVHAARDLTRGGLGTALTELASDAGAGIDVEYAAIPVQPEVTMASEMLGIDPIYLANEGCCLVFCAPSIADDLVKVLRESKYGAKAARIGTVVERPDCAVVSRSDTGEIIIEPLVGAQLPRLC